MKITRRQIRRVIAEEISKIIESPSPMPSDILISEDVKSAMAELASAVIEKLEGSADDPLGGMLSMLGLAAEIGADAPALLDCAQMMQSGDINPGKAVVCLSLLEKHRQSLETHLPGQSANILTIIEWIGSFNKEMLRMDIDSLRSSGRVQ